MKRPHLWTAIAFTALLSACATTSSNENHAAARFGMDRDEVRHAMGEPTRMIRNPDGVEIWFYDRADSNEGVTVNFLWGKVTRTGEFSDSTRAGSK